MQIIKARNVHTAFPHAIKLLKEIGQIRDSRNGPVLVAPYPVATEYLRPWERVIFWPQRDANPFLHLYEALWMLAGRNDLAPLLKFTENFRNYSDDGIIMHGAYGYRWRHSNCGDQLAMISSRLRKDPTDRRSVLQMWDSFQDLGGGGTDYPCNLVATFQRDADGALDMTVFCRSNDIIWGCYGANAVHFSLLQEYMARWIGCPIGIYRQISVNWHAYLNVLEDLTRKSDMEHYDQCPYSQGQVRRATPELTEFEQALIEINRVIDSDFVTEWDNAWFGWTRLLYTLFKAHHIWKTAAAPERYTHSISYLNCADPNNDWIVAARQWLQRRYDNWERKMKS